MTAVDDDANGKWQKKKKQKNYNKKAKGNSKRFVGAIQIIYDNSVPTFYTNNPTKHNQTVLVTTTRAVVVVLSFGEIFE